MASSADAFARAQHILVGGVNSPVRSFRNVGGTPRFLARAAGARVWDIDGREYIDYVGSWGPAILGHAHPAVVQAVQDAAARGLSFGAPTEMETALGELVRACVPSMERIRFVSSGTEATMSALRLARGCTRRDAILKFDGCYHGHADSLLVQAGSGALSHGHPDSAGVPDDFAKHTLVLPYNDSAAVQALFRACGDTLAAVIVEPVAGNMGCVLPQPEFLETLRTLCTQYGAILIFDEVMTGFRVALGGAQQRFGVTPDLTCLGKILGGGLPVAAYGGRQDLMEQLAPLGPVYQAGTLSGNPLGMAAGIATLQLLLRPGVYEQLEKITQRLMTGFVAVAREKNIPLATVQCGGMWSIYFSAGSITNLSDVQRSDVARFKTYFHAMLDRGIYLAPSPFEAGFVSLAHTEEDIDATIAAAGEAMKL